MDVQAPLTTQVVYAAISGATRVDAQERTQSENILRSWERDAVPGFLDSLLQISGQAVMVDEESRILAAVVAKNAVGSSWRKTLGSREWSRVPEAEKAVVRRRAVACLLEDPSERVAIQMALLITNIARFDFPSKWPELLTQLTEAASFTAPTAVAAKRRALRALKNIVRALRNKRIVAESPRLDAGRMSPEDLVPLAKRIAQERTQLTQQVELTFMMMKDMWQQNFTAVIQGSHDWEARGHCANQVLQVLREILMLLPSWEGLEGAMQQFLESVHAAASATATVVPAADESDEDDPNSRLAICGKTFERATQCAMAAMDRNPVEFASYLPYFLPLYSNNALLTMDAAAVHRIRPKRRILLMQFLARALLCPVYQTEWLDAHGADAGAALQMEEVNTARPKIIAADKALTDLHTEPQCMRLVESIVTKYLALTPAELEEWQADPEGYVRSTDVESTPDADTPRPCGVALLLCLLSRGEGTVASTLIQIASSLQAQPRTPEVLLLQEACYRALGEAFSQLQALPGIVFADWYTSELRGLLQPKQGEVGMHHMALRARAIWLMGICCSELPGELWADATTLVVQNLANADLVVALTSVSAMVGIVSNLLDESLALPQEEELHHQIAASSADAAEAVQAANAAAPAIASRRAAHQAKLDLLEGQAGNLLGLALALQGRLEEIESRVRVLQLVSLTIEALGDRAQPALGVIADALPQVWTVAAEASSSGRETGAVARLHSALMGVLTHLVDRLGRLATEHSHISQVLLPILAHSLDLANPETETLVEDALKLLRVTLSGCSQLTPALQALLQRVVQILMKGRDSAAALTVIEGYLLLAGPELPELLQPYLPSIAAALERCVNAAANALAARESAAAAPKGAGEKQQPPPAVPTETIADAMAASSMCTLLLQLNVDSSVLESTLRAMAAVVSSKHTVESIAPMGVGPRTLSNAVEGFLEVLTRVLFNQPGALPLLLQSDVEAEGRFLDRWLSISSRKYLAEVLGDPRMSGLGRLRRHMATASLCKLAVANASPALRDTRRMAKALALGLRTLAERPDYECDQRDIEEVLQQQAARANAIRDTIMLHRLSLTRADAIRQFNTRAAVAEAAKAALSYCPQQELLECVSLIDPRLEALLAELLGGGGGGSGGNNLAQIGGAPGPSLLTSQPQPMTEAL